MRLSPALRAMAFSYAAVSRPRVAGGVLSVLWALAGAAMLAFTLFLGVLIVAGIGLRLAPRRARPRPGLVFAASSVIVVLTASALLVPGLVRTGDDSARPRPAPVPAAERPPPHVYPPMRDVPLRYALGGASGRGLASGRTRSLVLYPTNPSDESGELNATTLANLLSHFGGWTAHPVSRYRTGEMGSYDAVFYVGGTSGTALPAAFLDDVLRDRGPVTWLGSGIDQLAARNPAAWQRYRFSAGGWVPGPFRQVRYGDAALPIHQMDPRGLVGISVADPATVTVLGTATGPGAPAPWAVHSRNLVFVAEDPLPYLGYDNDRYLAFADLLFEVLDPRAAPRHRALIRLEDVGPTADPGTLRQVVDYLSGQGVPFSVGVYPVYRDPNGVTDHGRDVTVRLSQRPAVVAALRYALSHGGTLVMHGYTHQYANRANPSDGASGQDAEFYLCHFDAARRMIPDGPVPEDSPAWALARIDQGLAELERAGLPRPSIFEFPHYMASPNDYLAAGQRFAYRYERALYFPGLLSRQPVPDGQRSWQSFPYPVRDVYGAAVVPENLDYVTSSGDSVPAMIQAARGNLVVRDGVASFFYHPFLGVGQLPRLVDGIRALGFTFVGSQQVVTG